MTTTSHIFFNVNEPTPLQEIHVGEIVRINKGAVPQDFIAGDTLVVDGCHITLLHEPVDDFRQLWIGLVVRDRSNLPGFGFALRSPV